MSGAIFAQGQPYRLKVLKTEILSVGDTAEGLNPPPTSAGDGHILGVFIECQGAAVRWRADGADPTSTEGHFLDAGDTASLFLPPSSIRFIADTSAGSTATLVVDHLGV